MPSLGVRLLDKIAITAAAPPRFVFNIKVFGLFTHHPVVLERLPATERSCCRLPWRERVVSTDSTMGSPGPRIPGPVMHDLLTALSNFVGVPFARDFEPFAVWAATPDVRRLRT
jgi:hypothetical protein